MELHRLGHSIEASTQYFIVEFTSFKSLKTRKCHRYHIEKIQSTCEIVLKNACSTPSNGLSVILMVSRSIFGK